MFLVTDFPLTDVGGWQSSINIYYSIIVVLLLVLSQLLIKQFPVINHNHETSAISDAHWRSAKELSCSIPCSL